MDFVERLAGLAGGSRPSPTANQKLFDFSNLSPAVQSHLQQVRRRCRLPQALAPLPSPRKVSHLP
jgi:hypothetical protein